MISLVKTMLKQVSLFSEAAPGHLEIGPGLTPETWEGQLAPFVAESRIQVGLRFEEEHMLKVNRTRLIVGRILEIRFPQEIQQSDGTLDLEKAKVVTISGADTYSLPATIRRMPYVRL